MDALARKDKGNAVAFIGRWGLVDIIPIPMVPDNDDKAIRIFSLDGFDEPS